MQPNGPVNQRVPALVDFLVEAMAKPIQEQELAIGPEDMARSQACAQDFQSNDRGEKPKFAFALRLEAPVRER